MMDEGDFIVFLIVTTVTISYLLLDKKFWNKCKSSIFECYYNHFPQSQTNRLSLLALRQWEYRGEGNEYLAISLPEKRKILRLRKSLCPNGFIENIKNWYSQNFNITKNEEEMKAEIFEKLNLEYYKILVLLIGDSYVQPSEDVLLIRDEIEKINTIVASKRPEYRKNKKIGYACGSILTDYVHLPSEWKISQFDGNAFAVEIKPKQGWIPEPERIYQLCTYCLKQYIKLENGETSKISAYCPMDLFSGQKSRMKLAIKCLLNSPQNNLKIFQEGILVYGENVQREYENVLSYIFKMDIAKSIDEFCDLVTTALLKQLYTDAHSCSLNSHKISNTLNKNYASYTNKVCNINRSNLPQGCVLDRILNLQELDSWGTIKVAEFLSQQPATYKDNIYGHATSAINRAKNKNNLFNCAKCFFIEKDGEETLDLKIQKYLMSAIAKDCSLMITFRKVKNGVNVTIPNEHLIRSETHVYAFNIGVFDLYPKPLTCICKHIRKRNKFIQIYKYLTNGNDNCVESSNI